MKNGEPFVPPHLASLVSAHIHHAAPIPSVHIEYRFQTPTHSHSLCIKVFHVRSMGGCFYHLTRLGFGGRLWLAGRRINGANAIHDNLIAAARAVLEACLIGI